MTTKKKTSYNKQYCKVLNHNLFKLNVIILTSRESNQFINVLLNETNIC